MIQFVLCTKQLDIRESLLYDTIYIICKAIGHSGPEVYSMIQFVLFTKQLSIRDLEILLYDTIGKSTF